MVMESFPFFEQPDQFNVTLDGDRHTAIIKWNFAGERWYLWLYDNVGDLIMCNPVIESTRDLPSNLLAGYFFNNSMIYNTFVNAFEVS
jgi:hypothetical protein